MRVSTRLSVLLAAASTHVSAQETGKLGDAAEVSNNPVGVVYKATLPENAYFQGAYMDGGNIEGEVTATAEPDGKGVRFTVKLSNLPRSGGPFPYHLHVAPVPDDGNCTVTLAHLDPYVRGEATPCDKNAPETCQVGDLSGKHGAIPADTDTFEASYVDAYASTLEGLGSFFGNRSIVFHFPNKTRITCASFEKVEGGAELPGPGDDDDDGTASSTSSAPSGIVTPPPSSTQGGSGNGTATTAATSSVATGAANGLRAGAAGAAVIGGAAFAFLL
ncbi:superoxide dismutase [Parachaetomium inaequale]|uniref:superoxide dismutase n=1 Tax=Parachaetomium inaequale TaxID=2588326 RepID=A0AAN6PPK9_9PEZI|nr:superoxide dismutase [Parachaetomium inaequale]